MAEESPTPTPEGQSSPESPEEAKGETKPVEEGEKPPAEPEAPPPYTGWLSSSFLAENEVLPFIDFSSYPKDVYQKLKEETFKAVPNFREKPIMDSFVELVTEFDKHSINMILNEPSELIVEFTEFVKARLNSEAHKFLVNYWPPVMPLSDYTAMIFFFIKMLHSLQVVYPFLAWLSCSVYPAAFTKEYRSEVIAACRCNVQGLKTSCWATMDIRKNIKIYKYEKGEYALEKSEPVSHLKIEDGHIKIESNDMPLATIIPDDSEQGGLWRTVYMKPVPFVYFITSRMNPTVEEVYNAAFHAIVNADAQVLQAFLHPSLIDPKAMDGAKLITSFLNLYSHAGKLVTFYCTVIIKDLGDFDGPLDGSFPSENSTSFVCETIFEKYGRIYVDNFIKFLAEYIEETGGFGIDSDTPDLAQVEHLISTIIKYICLSYALVPPQIRQLLNILRTLVEARINIRATLYKVLSNVFFVRFFCAVFANIQDYVSSIRKTSMFAKLAKLLEMVFTMGQMNGDLSVYEPLMTRLERHVYPRLMEFIFSISDYSYAEFEVETLPELTLSKQLDEIINIIATKSDVFIPLFKEVLALKTITNKPTILGSNFAGSLCEFFIHGYDTIEAEDMVEEHMKVHSSKDKRRHHQKLIRSDILPNESPKGSQAHDGKEQKKVVDPSNPRRLCKRTLSKVMYK